MTVGADYTAAATWKASGLVQWPTSSSSSSWLVPGALANKLDDSWTLLNRGLSSDQTNRGATGGRLFSAPNVADTPTASSTRRQPKSTNAAGLTEIVEAAIA